MLEKINDYSRLWKSLSFTDRLIIYLFVISCIYSIFIIAAGWWRPILDFHGFRQTQTAISTYYLLHGSDWLAYQTPVFGPPWSIPFEFPLYQWCVALLVRLSGAPLDQAGRFISVVFFYASLFPVYGILKLLHVRSIDRLLFLTLILVSPLYLFWSRTFMIESTALFLSVVYLYCFILSESSGRTSMLFIAALAGLLAAVVKITTFFGFAAAALVYMLARIRQEGRPETIGSLFRVRAGQAVMLFILPLLALLWWTHYADALKSQNMLAGFIVSSNLTQWNFGTLGQRVSAMFWDKTILHRVIPDTIGSSLVLILPLILFGLWFRTNRFRWYIIACLLLFLLVPLTFTNLHIIHDYYSYASGIYLLMAIGFVLVGADDNQALARGAKLLVTIALVISGVSGYQNNYIQRQLHKDTDLFMQTSVVIRQLTDPQDLVVVYGYDWHPGLLYYGKRRGIMMRSAMDPEAEKFRKLKNEIADARIGAIVVCRKQYIRHYQQVLVDVTAFGGGMIPVFRNKLCDIYTPPADNSGKNHILQNGGR